MVPLERGPSPQVLVEKAADWTADYVARRQTSPTMRPRKERYRHEQVLVELRRMSGSKCFYCERKLSEAEEQVDHHLEVAERPELAFDWANLYLACPECNNQKAPNTQIAVTACVDPCERGVRPDVHLVFDDERIEPHDGSALGRRTISKYRLDRQELDLARARVLNEFNKALRVVQDRRIRDGGRPMSSEEIRLLRAYGDSARPFSLMVSTLLARLAI